MNGRYSSVVKNGDEQEEEISYSEPEDNNSSPPPRRRRRSSSSRNEETNDDDYDVFSSWQRNDGDEAVAAVAVLRCRTQSEPDVRRRQRRTISTLRQRRRPPPRHLASPDDLSLSRAGTFADATTTALIDSNHHESSAAVEVVSAPPSSTTVSTAASLLQTESTTPITEQQSVVVDSSRRMIFRNTAIGTTATSSSPRNNSTNRRNNPSTIQLTQQGQEGLTAQNGNDGTSSAINEGGTDEAQQQRQGSSDDDNDDEQLVVAARDEQLRARSRWIRINRRFQLVITFVALLFSLLLFAILLCWVVLASIYVVSFDKSCDDVPLKPYFWLVTLQLMLDIFRGDIMRFVFRWDSRSNHRLPAVVIAYHVAYLLYAVMVLRLGIRSVFVYDETPECKSTAPDLFNASTAFVSLSIAAWATIIGGYLIPFCVVAGLLTLNGYNPSSDVHDGSAAANNAAPQAVFPAAYATSGAPAECIDQLPVLSMRDVPVDDYHPPECCICMEEFHPQDVVVETKCKHIFHKPCCREWLRQARTCPVCRDDIPSTLEGDDVVVGIETTGSNLSNTSRNNEIPTIPIGPTGRPVTGLWRALRNARSFDLGTGSRNRSYSIEMEEGRGSR